MAKRIEPKTGIIQESDTVCGFSTWKDAENENGNSERVNTDTGIIEEKEFVCGIFPVWNSKEDKSDDTSNSSSYSFNSFRYLDSQRILFYFEGICLFIIIIYGAHYGYQDGGGLSGAIRWVIIYVIIAVIILSLIPTFLKILAGLITFWLIMNFFVFVFTGHFM